MSQHCPAPGRLAADADAAVCPAPRGAGHGPASRGQAAEINAWSAARGARGEAVPGSLALDPDTPGGVARRELGLLTEITLWNFATGSAALKDAHRLAVLNLILDGSLRDARLEIEGHTSPAGDGAANQALADARAAAVAEALGEHAPPETRRFGTASADSQSPAGADAARDRAVTLRLLRPPPQQAPARDPKADRWRPDPRRGDLAHGFYKLPPPPPGVMSTLMATWPPMARAANFHEVAGPFVGLLRAIPVGSPAGQLPGRAGHAGAAAHGAHDLAGPLPTVDARVEALHAATFSDFQRWAASGDWQGLPPCGFDPEYRLIDPQGEVLDTTVYDLMKGN